MSRQIQIRRGSATDHANFTGAIGEITMDTTNKTLRVHDGTTAGGTILAKKSEIPIIPNFPDSMDYVVETQLPTSQNNYTWYRKYKSGWVEQGGIVSATSSYASKSIPVTMANTNYTLSCNTIESFAGIQYCVVYIDSVSSFTIKYTGTGTASCTWQISGPAA
ncbi:MAG: hypothetical protein MJ165_04365 [Alphaproteobacteria bacterium]|nr:hypothetical protein [Alphaproteobacteria bacterium]